MPNFVRPVWGLKPSGTSPIWLSKYSLSQEVGGRAGDGGGSGVPGQWIWLSTFPSASPASASGIETSSVPWRQLSNTQLSLKTPSFMPGHMIPVPTACGTSGSNGACPRA